MGRRHKSIGRVAILISTVVIAGIFTAVAAAEQTATGSYSPCSAYATIHLDGTSKFWGTGQIYSCGSMTICLQVSSNGSNWEAPFSCVTGAGANIRTPSGSGSFQCFHDEYPYVRVKATIGGIATFYSPRLQC
jgi:hypothetical protein